MAETEVKNLNKFFSTEQGEVKALDDVSFTVPEGSLFTLLGPSGCGKSTTLRCVAGLEFPDDGTIKIGGGTVFSKTNQKIVPPEHREIGMVFQSYAIWPHMTVFENVAYPLQDRGLSKNDINNRVKETLRMVGLEELIKRPATNLSGGQQQRVAVARALVAKPKVLLLDEPLSNLDAKLREEMRMEIRRLQQKTGITAIYVTHDQEEALVVSDRILFMHEGKIIEQGTPQEIYTYPQKKLTADFFGKSNFLKAEVKSSRGDLLIVATHGGNLICSGKNAGNKEVTIFFRPENVNAIREVPDDEFYLIGIIDEIQFLGSRFECSIEVGVGEQLTISLHPSFLPKKGEKVNLVIRPNLCHVIY